MLLHIPEVLLPNELEAMRRVLDQSAFVDGKLTAGRAAERVKHNTELDRDLPQRDALTQIVVTALYRSETFRSAALPLKLGTPIFARYTPGMAYGWHVDDPVMGQGPHYRTDVSFTLFLSEPEEYDGGELVIRTAFGEQKVKLKAGDAVIYPSGTLHQVAEVTRGVRLVSIGWVQSMVRDPARREILFELGGARDTLLAETPGTAATDAVDHAYINLVRMWAET
jgi:PKHD-type hydroxylase